MSNYSHIERCDIITHPCQLACERHHGPLARYVKFRVPHALGMPGTLSPPLQLSNPDMHHGTCVTHVPWCMPGSLTSGFLWNRWRGKRSRHSRRMRNPQFYVSGKRTMVVPSGRHAIGDRHADFNVISECFGRKWTRFSGNMSWAFI